MKGIVFLCNPEGHYAKYVDGKLSGFDTTNKADNLMVDVMNCSGKKVKIFFCLDDKWVLNSGQTVTFPAKLEEAKFYGIEFVGTFNKS